MDKKIFVNIYTSTTEYRNRKEAFGGFSIRSRFHSWDLMKYEPFTGINSFSDILWLSII